MFDPLTNRTEYFSSDLSTSAQYLSSAYFGISNMVFLIGSRQHSDYHHPRLSLGKLISLSLKLSRRLTMISDAFSESNDQGFPKPMILSTQLCDVSIFYVAPNV